MHSHCGNSLSGSQEVTHGTTILLQVFNYVEMKAHVHTETYLFTRGLQQLNCSIPKLKTAQVDTTAWSKANTQRCVQPAEPGSSLTRNSLRESQNNCEERNGRQNTVYTVRSIYINSRKCKLLCDWSAAQRPGGGQEALPGA